jgi:hypothetical protein
MFLTPRNKYVRRLPAVVDLPFGGPDKQKYDLSCNFTTLSVHKTNTPVKRITVDAENAWKGVKMRSRFDELADNLDYSCFVKSAPSESCSSLDVLMGMTGLESVKQSFLNMFYRVDIAIKQGLDFKRTNLNIRLDGNPGTGKTTVAKLYATFLIQVGVLPKASTVIVTSGVFS